MSGLIDPEELKKLTGPNVDFGDYDNTWTAKKTVTDPSAYNLFSELGEVKRQKVLENTLFATREPVKYKEERDKKVQDINIAVAQMYSAIHKDHTAIGESQSEAHAAALCSAKSLYNAKMAALSKVMPDVTPDLFLKVQRK